MTVKALKKQLMAAIAMVVVSAIALSSSTYAWFASNTQVTAKNMQVTAKADSGIVIGAYTDESTAPEATNFGIEANALTSAMANMLPTFTKDASKWYHANSKVATDGQDYTVEGYSVVDNVAAGAGTPATNYYLLNKFQIKATGEAQDVYVKEITVTAGGGQAYDASIRVLVKSADATLVFAPVGTHTGDAATETAKASIAAADAVDEDITMTLVKVNTEDAQILDGVAATAKDVFIYIYYDGEDAACKSENIDTFVGTTLSVDFTTIAPLPIS